MFEDILAAALGGSLASASIKFNAETPLDEIVTQLLDQKVPHIIAHKVIEAASKKVKCTDEQIQDAQDRICKYYEGAKRDTDPSPSSAINDFFQSLSQFIEQQEPEEEPDHFRYSLANFLTECETMMRNFLRYIPRKYFNQYSLINEDRIVKLMSLYLRNSNSEELGATMLINEAHDIEVKLKNTMKQITA